MEILLDVVKWSAAVGAAALVLTLLKPALDKRYSARWRYWVWLAMAALLLLAPVQWGALLPAAEAPVVIDVPPMELHISREEGVALQRPPAAHPAAVPAAEGRTLPLDTLLPALWLAGAGLYALRRLLGTAFFLRRAGRWSRSAGEETARLYGAVCREMGLKKAPVLRVSTAAASPMLAGLLRPRLFLPTEDCGPRELRFILRHELTHYRRRDLWYKLVMLAANALHWFNPLAYLLTREAEADLELTCDDLVMAGADAEERRAYSEALLSAVRRQKGLSRSALSTHFYGGAPVMKERFRNILGIRGHRWGGMVLAVALALTVATACAVSLRREEPEEPLEEDIPGSLDGETAQAEDWARKVMENDAQSLGLEAERRSVDYLTRQGSCEVGGTAYSAWQLGYRLVPAGGEAVVRRGFGILWRQDGGESGGDWREDEDQPWEVGQGYTWEEYLVCYAAYGMRLPTAEGWPALTDGFLADFLDGHNTWAAEPQGAALEYLSREHGVTAEGGVDTLYAFAGETSCLLETSCGGETVRLLLRRQSVAGSGAGIWQVQAAQWSGDTLVYTDRAELGSGVTGQLDLYGRRPEYGGSWGISRVVWTPSSGRASEFLISDAIALAQPAGTPLTEEEAVYTDCRSPDGGLTLEDVNFDGYLDIGLQASVTAYNLPYYYWTYDPSAGGFDFAFWLLGPMTADAANRQLICENHDGPTYYTEYYVYDPSGQLYLARRDTRELGGGGREYTETFDEPAYDWRGGSCSELTAAELASFADYFNSVEHNGLLRFPLRSSHDIPAMGDFLPILFYDHNGSAGEMTAEERAAVEAAMGGPLELDVRKLTTEYITDYLAANYPIVREEGEALLRAGGDTLGLYLPEYDAYYSQRGDTEMQVYRFDSGTRFSDGRVALYYTAHVWDRDGSELMIRLDQPMRAVVSPCGDGWVMEQNDIL